MVVAVLFIMGLTQLFLLRFKVGDVYPAYSSLRADPLGVRVLFDSLDRIGKHAPRRNFRPPDQVALTPQTTLLVCGLDSSGSFLRDKRVHGLMDHVAASGGRLVLTFSTRLGKKRNKNTETEEKDVEDPGSQPSDAKKDHVDASGKAQEDKWLGAPSLGFEFEHFRQAVGDDTASSVDTHNRSRPLTIPWRTTLYFDLKDKAWQVLYSWQQEAVVVQRPWGRGMVVMSADSYLFSNEALRNQRSAALLACILVPGHTVIFDEFHLGLARRPGIATLARQYRLQGVFGALLVVVALLGWHQAAVFVPSLQGQGESSGPAIGRDTGQGVVDLARRHIQPAELLGVCFDAWLPNRDKRVPENLVAQVRAIVQAAAESPRQTDPVKIYRRICELLKQGKRP
jgi:Domain of unknown function (DUF4350)